MQIVRQFQRKYNVFLVYHELGSNAIIYEQKINFSHVILILIHSKKRNKNLPIDFPFNAFGVGTKKTGSASLFETLFCCCITR